MKNQPDVLIIGGGVIGVCTAYYLAELGREVTLLEMSEICSGSSYGNAGLIAYGHAIPIASPGVISQGLRWLLRPDGPFYIKPRFDPALLHWLWLFRAACSEAFMLKTIPVILDLGQASKKLFETLHTSEEMDFSYRYDGRLYIFNSEAGFEEGIATAKVLGKLGFQTRVIDRQAVRHLVPCALPCIVGGIHSLDYGQLIPHHFVNSMAKAATRRGAEIRTATEVIGFETSAGCISTVFTTRGVFRPRQVVLAAGALSTRLAKDLGLRLPVQPAKGYSATFKCSRDWPRLPLSLEEERIAVAQMGESVRFSSSLHLAGYDTSLRQRNLEAIRKGVKAYLGGGDDLELQEFWCGFRPLTPDGLPIIGRSSTQDNLIIATGHGMLGMTQGPITGKLVSQLVVGEEPQIDLYPLRAERFG